MDALLKKPRPFVNFALLTNDNRYLNQIVALIGRVNEGDVDENGYYAKVDTSDHQKIIVRFHEPLCEPLTNFVQFIGKVAKGGRELECLEYVTIKDEITHNFDFDMFNKMIGLTQKNTVQMDDQFY